MKKVVLALSLLIISPAIYPMGILTAMDPTRDESERGLLGSVLRRLLKSSGTLNYDLVGLGSSTEKARTEKIFADLDKNPSDPHLQKQFCERQAIATTMALSLIAQLENWAKDPEPNQTSSSTTSYVQDTSYALELIESSSKLRKLSIINKSLPPAYNSRLAKATNQARKRIKNLLHMTDESTSQDALLKEEIVDDKPIDVFPRRAVIAHTLKLLKEGSVEGDEKLAEALPNKIVLTHVSKLLNDAPETLLARKKLIAHTLKLLTETPLPDDDEELTLINSLAELTLNQASIQSVLKRADDLSKAGHILGPPHDDEDDED
jgi:hypothetical protein